MDKDSQDLVKAASQGLAHGTTAAFLEKLFGPAVEAGEILRDWVRFRRFKSQVRTLEKARAFLEERGIPPESVSMKVLVPLLEAAALEDEDDDTMIDRWASLLANAAAGPNGSAVLPSFPGILAELSPEEAVILDTLYREAEPTDVPSLHRIYVPDSGLGEGDPLFVSRCYNLDRLGLLEVGWENVQLPNTDSVRYKHTVASLEGTALGLSFVKACSPPRGTP